MTLGQIIIIVAPYAVAAACAACAVVAASSAYESLRIHRVIQRRLADSHETRATPRPPSAMSKDLAAQG